MSTFVRTSSHSHLAESLDKCLRQECKLGLTIHHLLSHVVLSAVVAGSYTVIPKVQTVARGPYVAKM